MDNQPEKSGITEEQAYFNKLSARAAYISAFAAIIGVLVGSAGVYLGWQSLQLTKKIEALRLKPHLTLYGRTGNSDGSFLYLKNNGPGAALIKELRFWNNQFGGSVDMLSKDGKNYAGNAIKVILTPLIQELDEKQPNITVASYQPEHVLPAGDSLRLLSFADPSNIDKELHDYVVTVINNADEVGMSYSIKFCSLDELFCDEITPDT